MSFVNFSCVIFPSQHIPIPTNHILLSETSFVFRESYYQKNNIFPLKCASKENAAQN